MNNYSKFIALNKIINNKKHQNESKVTIKKSHRKP